MITWRGLLFDTWKGEKVKRWNRGVFVKTWKGEKVKRWKGEKVKSWCFRQKSEGKGRRSRRWGQRAVSLALSTAPPEVGGNKNTEYKKKQLSADRGKAVRWWRKRREQDSNLRTGFAGYTLSRRASSTTRAPLLLKKPLQNYRKYSMQTNVAKNNYEKLILPCSLVDTPPSPQETGWQPEPHHRTPPPTPWPTPRNRQKTLIMVKFRQLHNITPWIMERILYLCK